MGKGKREGRREAQKKRTRHKGTNNETKVNDGVGEQNEDKVAPAAANLARRLGATHGTGRVLAANTDTDEETPCSQHVEHADSIAVVVGASSQSSEDEKDDGGDKQRVGARPAVSKDTEEQLANDGTGEDDGTNDALGPGVGPRIAVLLSQNGGNGADDLHLLALILKPLKTVFAPSTLGESSRC